MSEDIKEVLCIKDYGFNEDNGYLVLKKGELYPVGTSSYSDELLVTSVNQQGQECIVNSLDELLAEQVVQLKS